MFTKDYRYRLLVLVRNSRFSPELQASVTRVARLESGILQYILNPELCTLNRRYSCGHRTSQYSFCYKVHPSASLIILAPPTPKLLNRTIGFEDYAAEKPWILAPVV